MPIQRVSDALKNETSASSYGFKNRIINGAMVVDQRNNGGAVTGQQYLVDRWRTWFDPGTYSFQQVSDAPTGFYNSLKITKTNTTQSNYGILLQHIEGLNVADLGWGDIGASPVTVSFWVKGSITGTYSGALNNSGESRSCMFTYTINQANTWEFKTATILGDTTGTWNKNTSTGIQIRFNFGNPTATSGVAGTWYAGDYLVASGANTNLGTTNGATWQVTGVQLEKGSVATPFDWRPYNTELQLCQRYYETGVIQLVSEGAQYAGYRYLGGTPFKVLKRANASGSGTFSYCWPNGAASSTFVVEGTTQHDIRFLDQATANEIYNISWAASAEL